MSRRTFPRVAAGLLAVALIASPPPALGQQPANPWRQAAAVEVAPPPRVKLNHIEFELTVPSSGPATFSISSNLFPTASIPLKAQSAKPPCCDAAGCCDAPVAKPVTREAIEYRAIAAPGQSVFPPAPPIAVTTQPYSAPLLPVPQGGTIFVRSAPVPPPGPAVAVVTSVASYRPLGTWYREVPGCVFAITFKGETCKVTATLNADGVLSTVTLTADCAMTADGTVHGVVTGADVDLSGVKDDAGMEWAETCMALQGLVDQPFAFRCRPTDGGLMISSLRVGSSQELPTGAVTVTVGKYKHAADGKVPAPKGGVMKQKVMHDCIDVPCLPPGAMLPPGLVCPQPPVGVPGQQPCPVPANCPPAVFELMNGVLGQMMSDRVGRVIVEGNTIVGDRVIRQQLPDVVCPQVREIVAREAVMLPPSPYAAPCPAPAVPPTVPAPVQAKLTLTDVTDLVKAGIGDEVIINHVRTTGSTFKLTAQDLIQLKKCGASDRLMLHLQGQNPPVASFTVPLFGGQ